MTAMTSIPALTAPTGETTNFEAPNILWKWNALCQTACLSIPGVVLFLRIYIRIWIKRVWILEDYLCCCAFVGLAVYSGLLTAIIAKHGGSHQWNITRPGFDSHPLCTYVNIIQIWYDFVAACIKSTILLLYLRVFSPRRRDCFALAIFGLIFVICIFYFALTIAKICQCFPRARIWDKSIPGTCVSLQALLDSSGLFNIVSDVCILLVPLRGIWNLQISRKRKSGIYAIFTVGVIAPVFSTIGFVKRFELVSNLDQSYNQLLVLLWAFVSSISSVIFYSRLNDYRAAELAAGMMVICLPTLPGILHHRKRISSTSNINASAKSQIPRYAMGSNQMNNQVSDRDYFELTEEQSHAAHISIPQNVLVTDIRGGVENISTADEFDLRRNTTPPAGIMKMTKVEISAA